MGIIFSISYNKSSPNFPLLKLPEVALLVVTNRMDLVTLLELSMMSPQFKMFLTKYRLKNTRISVNIDSTYLLPRDASRTRSSHDYMSLSVSMPKRYFDGSEDFPERFKENNEVMFQFIAGEHYSELGPAHAPRKVNNINILMGRDIESRMERIFSYKLLSSLKEYFCSRKSSFKFNIKGRDTCSKADTDNEDLETLEHLSQHLMDICRLKSYTFNYEQLEDFDINSCYIWKYANKAKSPSIDFKSHRNKTLIEYYDYEHSEEVEFSIHGTSGLNTTRLILSPPKLYLSNLTASTVYLLMNCKSTEIEIKIDKEEANQVRIIQMIVVGWKIGKMVENLKFLKVEHSDYSITVLEGLDRIKGVTDEGDRNDVDYWRKGHWTKRNTTRVTDGKVADLAVKILEFTMSIQ